MENQATNSFKITQKIILNIIFFAFKNFSKDFRECIRTENPSYKIV